MINAIVFALSITPEMQTDQELYECLQEIESNQVCCVWIDSDQHIFVKDGDSTFKSLNIDPSIKRTICDETKGTITL